MSFAASDFLEFCKYPLLPPAEFQSLIRDQYTEYSIEARDFPEAPSSVPPEVIEFLKKLSASEPPVHRFENANQERYVTLSDSSLDITELNYCKRENFFPHVQSVEKAFSQIYKPAPYTRIGLRYVNVINRKQLDLDDTDWVELLRPELLGFLNTPPVLGGTVVETRGQIDIEIQGFLKKANPTAHCRIRHGLAPPDPETRVDGSLYYLDTDFYFKFSKKGPNPNVYKLIEAFSDEAGKIFRALITEKLHNALGPSPI